jgi:hypothetical protein
LLRVHPEFAQERTREAAAEALKASKKRNAQVKRLEAQKTEIEQAREKVLSDTYDELVRTLPEVLEVALTDIFAGNAFLRQYYDPDKSALANYQASMMFKEACRPYLERHTPERIQAVRTRYTKEIAALEEQLAALQAV